MSKNQRWLLWTFATLPMALLLAALARGLYVDYRAWVEVAPTVKKEAEKTATFYLPPTHISDTLGNDATVLSNMATAIRARANRSGIELSDNPAYSAYTRLINWPQDGEWTEPKVLDSILDYARPFFAQIDELVSRSETPQDLSHLLRQETSVLHLRFYAALHRKDSDELYRSLQTFAAILRQRQTAPDANSQEVYVRSVELRTYHVIRDFLNNHLEADQSRCFDVIAEILRPIDIEKRLQSAHEAKPLMMLGALSRFNDPREFTGLRFATNVDWANVEAAMALAAEPTSIRTRDQLPSAAMQWRASNTLIEENLFSFSPRHVQTNYNIQRHSFMRLAISLWRLEEARRVLMLGLAARHYETAHGHLPQGIAELLNDPRIPERIKTDLHRTSLEGQPFTHEKLDFESQAVFCINSHSQAWNITTNELFALNRIVLSPSNK